MPFNILTIFFISILFPKIFSFVGDCCTVTHKEKKGTDLFFLPVVCKQFRRPSSIVTESLITICNLV
jgi:hypothetical protein